MLHPLTYFMEYQVSGNIIIPADIMVNDCPLYIKVLNTSFADAPAKLVSEKTINFSKNALKNTSLLPFELNVESGINQASDYTLHVHLDVDKNGVLSKNDYLHDRSYPIITHGNPSRNLMISLKKIG